MPFALPDLQAAFAAQLTGADRPDLEAEVLGDAIPAAARLRVYRHHVRESLGAALAASFPTVQSVVGGDFFRGIARAFVAQSLPLQPVLAEYGEGFPTFIAAFEPARALPYLADVARLDWALNAAFHAPPDGRLAAVDLAAIAADRLPLLRLALAPGTALVNSPFPLDRIWAASQPGAPDGTVDLDDGSAHLLVLRRSDDAAFVVLSAAEARFAGSIALGKSLEEAAGMVEGEFDLAAGFGRLLNLGAFAALQ